MKMSDSPQPLNSLDCWDYSIELDCLQGNQDLQLAAELGKTLLERNKELEASLKQYQTVIDDQTQEIEYLTKQTVALREVNDSRLRIYEQLEVSIQDLERANHALAIDHANDKKQIKSLTSTIASLEAKCEELQGNIDDLKNQLAVCKRKPAENAQSVAKQQVPKFFAKNDTGQGGIVGSPTSPTNVQKETLKFRSPTKTTDKCQETQTTPSREENSVVSEVVPNEEQGDYISQLLSQIQEQTMQSARDIRRIAELEDQLSSMVHQNQEQEKRIANIQQDQVDAKSMHDELSTLEEVRQGHLCSKCLRTVDMKDSSLSLYDEDDSMLEALTNTPQFRSSFSMQVQEYSKTSTPAKHVEGNLYKDLAEKYEALVKVQKHGSNRVQKPTNGALSLQEELALSGDFNNPVVKDTDDESGHGDSLKPDVQKKMRKTFSHTPTDFSEAETSSSGFSDETSNKATQTELHPGSFLCSIGDGDESFKIYNNQAEITEGRFKSKPEYKELFAEIVDVLRKAAENKEKEKEVEKRVETTTESSAMEAIYDIIPDFSDTYTDDTQSIISSNMSEVSVSQNEPLTVIENADKLETEAETKGKTEPVLTPLRRKNLDYIAVGVSVRNNKRSSRKKKYVDQNTPQVTHIVGSPTIRIASRPNSSSRRRREPKTGDNGDTKWNFNTLHFYNRNIPSPTPSQCSTKSKSEEPISFKPSTASQDLHKLKKLDLSYAEVLRLADDKKRALNHSVRRK